MQPFSEESDLRLADEVVETGLLVTRVVRAEVRRQQPAMFSVSQLRALSFLRWNPGASLADVALHVGLGNPSTSKLVNDMVQRGLVEREPAGDDRRRLLLRLTSSGRQALAAVRAPTLARVAELLADLSEEEREVVMRASRLLQVRFDAQRERGEER